MTPSTDRTQLTERSEANARSTDSHPNKAPLGPDGRPFLLRQAEWVLKPATYLSRVGQTHPDFFQENILMFNEGKTTFVYEPEALQLMLSRDRTVFSAPGEYNTTLAPIVGNSSVIMLNGAAHRSRKQLMTPPFHGDRMQVYGDLICQLSHQMVSGLSQGEHFKARNVTQQFSLKVIAQLVLGMTNGPRASQMMEQLTTMVESFSAPISAAMLFFPFLQKDLGKWSPWGRFLQLRQRADELVYAEIEDRQAHPDPNRTDILSMLMAARTEAGEALTPKELRDELMALLLAGHETTASAVAWALYWIHREPDVKAKLLDELDAQPDDALPTELAQLPYLTAVCKEALRRSPVAMFTFPRVAQEPVDMLGQTFQPGDIFMGCIYLLHKRPDIYPDPEAFRPERFLERKFSPYEFMPFGHGARRCIGEALARYELKLSVATLLKHYRLELTSDRPEQSRRRGVTLAPHRGVPMRYLGKR